jgi:putative FmdB family regulatory protein
MPIYEYACEDCGHHFERFQSVQDAPIRQCPQCSGRVRKIFHPVGIVFKGSGWYITDSRKSTSSTSEDKSDTKPDTTTKTETTTSDTASA